MAGLVYLVVAPTNFVVVFALSELGALVSNFITKEGMPMGKRVVGSFKDRIMNAWGRHLPLSRVTLLTKP